MNEEKSACITGGGGGGGGGDDDDDGGDGLSAGAIASEYKYLEQNQEFYFVLYIVSIAGHQLVLP